MEAHRLGTSSGIEVEGEDVGTARGGGAPCKVGLSPIGSYAKRDLVGLGIDRQP